MSQNDKKAPLKKTEAELRKALITSDKDEYSIEYDLTLSIHRSSDIPKNSQHSFEGYLSLTFTYHPNQSRTADNPNCLFLNFFGEINSLVINEAKVSSFVFSNNRLIIDLSLLKEGSNNLKILYSGDYNHNGVGLHHFIDPKDKKEYCYTQFEPYDCHRLFPCFDQPDLKAVLKLKVIAPSEWKVLGNSYENSIIDISSPKVLEEFLKQKCGFDEEAYNHFVSKKNACILYKKYHLVIFDDTPRISTYLYALCAGEYFCIENTNECPIRLRIFMRDSLKEYGEIDEMFKVTIAGMKFYSSFFGYPFPFKKYDQVFCPEYNSGAMENVGLVTHNESYCWKSVPTHVRRTGFSYTVLHELAHMWFGNLVTMKWWDDLWLNESFATFMGHLCMSKSEDLNKKYSKVWVKFAIYKGSAYRADQLSTTHPVRNEVPDTAVAESGFDSLIYSKGSSILKQIYYYIGEENFSKGLKNYFETYQWGNTVFDNFIDKLIEGAGDQFKDLKNLCLNWLTKAGLNEITLDMQSDSSNNISKFVVKQKPCLDEFNNLQTHIVDFLFIYDFNDLSKNKVFKRQVIEPKPETEFDFSKEKVPKTVLLNYGDWGYMKLALDSNSIKGLKNELSTFKDDLVKATLYRSLFDMCRDAKISGAEFIDIAIDCMKNEREEQNLNSLLGYVNASLSSYIPLKYNQLYKQKVMTAMKCLIGSLSIEVDYQEDLVKRIFTYVPSLASCEKDYLYFIKLLNLGPSCIPQERRFSMVRQIFKSREIPLETKQKLLERECERDKNSNRSLEARILCDATIPDRKNKEKLWTKITEQSQSDSLNNIEHIMAGFAPKEQYDIVQDFLKEKFFEVLPEIAAKNERRFVQYFVNYFAPDDFIEDEIYKKMENLIQKLDGMEGMSQVNKYVKESLDLMNRKKKAHELCEKYLNSQS